MEDNPPMPKLALALIAVAFATGPALAQTAPADDTSATHSTRGTHRAHPAHKTRPQGTPLDKGPFTPEANRAYMGGGMILEGAPGAPAPRPEPTPPGQTPRNMVQ